MTHQLVAALRDLRSLRLRALVLLVQVTVVALALSITLGDGLRVVRTMSTAEELGGDRVTYFSLSYDDATEPALSPALRAQLGEHFDGSKNDYTLVKHNYAQSGVTRHPVVVAVGGFGAAYGFYRGAVDHEVVLIGSEVSDLRPGGTVDFGPNEGSVVRRLPPGAAYLDPWMGYESLDDSVVLLMSADRFLQTNPDWQTFGDLVGRAVFFDATPSSVDDYVETVSAAGSNLVVPQDLHSRVQSTYQRQLASDELLALFFAALLVVVLLTIVASLAGLVRDNLRRYTIELVYGAHVGAVMLRVHLVLALVFLLPTTAVLAIVDRGGEGLHGALLPALAVAVALQLLMPMGVLRQLRRLDLSTLLRKE